MKRKKSDAPASLQAPPRRLSSQRRRVVQARFSLLPEEYAQLRAAAASYTSVSQLLRTRLGYPPLERPQPTHPSAPVTAARSARTPRDTNLTAPAALPATSSKPPARAPDRESVSAAPVGVQLELFSASGSPAAALPETRPLNFMRFNLGRNFWRAKAARHKPDDSA